MKITYTSVTGEITEVEVSDEIGAVIIESRREEETRERRHRYHCYSYDAIEYEGEEYATKDTPESEYISNEEKIDMNRRLKQGLSLLTPTERKRLLMVAAGLSYREIARLEGVSSHSKIAKSVESARKKMKVFL